MWDWTHTCLCVFVRYDAYRHTHIHKYNFVHSFFASSVFIMCRSCIGRIHSVGPGLGPAVWAGIQVQWCLSCSLAGCTWLPTLTHSAKRLALAR